MHSNVSIAIRFAQHNRLWINDPDFALARSTDTSDDPDLNRLRPSLIFIEPDDLDTISPYGHDRAAGLSSMNFEEAKTLLSLVLISGGPVNLSDKLPLLNERGLDLLRRAVAAEQGEAGIPLDLFYSARPAIWLQKLTEGFRILLINWDNDERYFNFDLNRLSLENSDNDIYIHENIPWLKSIKLHKPFTCVQHKAKNFWTSEDLSVKSNRIETLIPAHGCLLAELMPSN